MKSEDLDTKAPLYLDLEDHTPLQGFPDEDPDLGAPRFTSQAFPSPCIHQSLEANVDTISPCPRGKKTPNSIILPQGGRQIYSKHAQQHQDKSKLLTTSTAGAQHMHTTAHCASCQLCSPEQPYPSVTGVSWSYECIRACLSASS